MEKPDIWFTIIKFKHCSHLLNLPSVTFICVFQTVHKEVVIAEK